MFINITSKNEYINGKSVAQPVAPITIKFEIEAKWPDL